ncbi:MAG: hypothetical protein ACKOXB_05390 [Flavobacteriales bacterium]
MRKYLVIAFVFSVQVLSAQQSKLITTSSKDGKYSISQMKEWNVSFQNGGKEIAIVVPLQNLDGIPAKFHLTKEENLPKDFNLETLATRNTLLITKFLKASTTELGSSSFNGITAQWVTYTYEINETEFKGLSYFFIINNVAYQMTVEAPTNDFQTMEILFRQVAESLVVK